MRTYVSGLSALVIAALLMSGCASDKVPAEQALKAAETAVNAAASEAAKYVPEQAQGLQSALTALKDKFAKGEYKAVLADSPALVAKVNEVTSAAAAKKAELTKTWEELSAGLPQMVEAIKSRVDALSASRKLPAKLTAATLDEAKSGLATIEQTWTEATDAATNGNFADAIAKAGTVKAQAVEIMGKLGMTVPEAAKS